MIEGSSIFQVIPHHLHSCIFIIDSQIQFQHSFEVYRIISDRKDRIPPKMDLLMEFFHFHRRRLWSAEEGEERRDVEDEARRTGGSRGHVEVDENCRSIIEDD